MIFGTVPLAEAEGGILAHSLLIAGRRWPKGHKLTAADIISAASNGVETLVIARLESGDIGEDAAAARLATALAGAGLAVLPAAHGRANLAATAAGILQFDPAMVAAVNTRDEALTLATLPANARVAAGDIVATIKVIRYAVSATALEAALAAAAPMQLYGFVPQVITLVSTILDGTSEKLLAKTERVTRTRLESMGCSMTTLPHCRHDTIALATALATAPPGILLIAGATATVDRADVIPAAITAAGGQVVRLGMPVDPGNLLCLGNFRGQPVIGLPGCARSPRRNGFDIVLERLVAGLAVTAQDIAMMGAGGLLPDAERPEPRAVAAIPTSVGAVILAAGRSSRMGADHKLLADWHGKTLIAHVADAIASAGLPPPIVVLGARAGEVRAALGDRPARFVVAEDHAEGLSRSLRAGIAGVPADWDAVLVCLGDMPRIEPALLRALAAASGDVVLPVWNARRGNPVRWGRRHFAGLMALDGDVGGKALLADAVALNEVPAPSDAVLDDIDTPEALAALRTR